MKLTVERIDDYYGPGANSWAVSDGEFGLVLDQPNHRFHLDMIVLKFEHEKEKG